MYTPVIQVPEFVTDTVAQLIATIAGVLIGAYLAFALERRKETVAENRRRAAAVNMTIHDLGRMLSDMLVYRREIVEPVRRSPMRWYSMLPAEIAITPAAEPDPAELQFLFTSGNPNVVATVMLEVRRFTDLRATIRQRSELHINDVQPRQEKAGLAGQATDAQLHDILGPRVVGLLKTYTDAIISHIDLNIESIQQAIVALRAAALPMVGTEKLIAFDLQKPDASKPAGN